MKDYMKKHLKKNTLLIILIFIFSIFTPNSSTAVFGTIPQPVIGTAQGFYAGKTYAAIFPVFASSWSLEPNEQIDGIQISVYQVELPGDRCNSGTRVAIGSKNLNRSTNKADANFILNFTVPETATNKTICAVADLKLNPPGFRTSSPTYVTVAPNPVVAASATPSVSASSSIVAEVMKPSGSKPSISGTPIEGSKFKVSIKAWNMNGNGFEGRSVYLKLCGDSNCNNLINSYPVVETGTLNFDVAKTLTMPKVVGKAGQFVYVVDSVITPYHGSADADYKEDYWTNLSSSMKKIEKVQKSSPSATPSSSQSIDESISVENQDMNSLENDAQVVTAPDTKEGSGIFSSFNFGIIIGLMSILLLILLLVLIYVIKNRK